MHEALVSDVIDHTGKTLAMIEGRGPVERIAFEDILRNPVQTAEALASCFREFGELDVAASAW